MVTNMFEFPVDEGNLSFSDDDSSNIFITQRTFQDVTTQEVDNAMDLFGLIDAGVGDNSLVQEELLK